jgi:integrase
MAGHIQDRWWRDAKDADGKPLLDAKGNPVREKTELFGKGLRYKVRYFDADGQERNKSFPDRQYTKAQNFLTEMQHHVLAGTYLDPKAAKITFREYGETVMMGRAQDESTADNTQRKLNNHIYPFLGKKPLERITTDVIRKWIAWLNAKDPRPADSYQRQIFDLVSSILDAAVRDKRMRANPCADKSISRPAKGAGKVTPWPETRMRKLELALPARFQIIVALGAGLGLRQGEIFAFSLDNVDRDAMVYHCTRQMLTLNGARKFRLPKGHKTRDIPLGVGVLEQLDAYAENYPPMAITLPWAERDGRASETINVLMTNTKNDLYTRQAFNNVVWKSAFAQAGLTYRADREDGMHALRHLYASHMLAQGVSIKELAAFLGHADEGFTLRTYVHLMPNSFERARLAVDQMFTPRHRPDADQAGETG